HAARRVVRGRHARHPHEGGTLRRDRQVHRRLLLRLDTLGARRARGRHLRPLGAWTVESATGPAEVVHALINPPNPILPVVRPIFVSGPREKRVESVLIVREPGAKMPADLGGDIYASLHPGEEAALLVDVMQFVRDRLRASAHVWSAFAVVAALQAVTLPPRALAGVARSLQATEI